MDKPTALGPAAAALAVSEVLTARGVAFTVHRHGEVRTVDDIRSRTAFDVENSVKAMAFTHDDRIVLAAVPGPARIRYGLLAAAVGARRTDLAAASQAVLRRLGMEPGGVSPVCQDPAVTVVFDPSVQRMGRVLCGSGRADCTLELEASDLVTIPAHAVIAAITAGG
ncbi:YbaK/EbsC family protein [Streptomyces sp. H51]|uniref:aminoacyl-tRNA deacylase n=1 Tax=Streptomyces sp. H51 TaxID=3111770 RepID=UPI002D76B25D|nr:YbaK/EbsC family protein [Streptomyces sp. H51]